MVCIKFLSLDMWGNKEGSYFRHCPLGEEKWKASVIHTYCGTFHVMILGY